MHSDRSDQSDRGLRRPWEGSQTRRGRPVARQQRSEVVAIAHARQAGEDVVLGLSSLPTSRRARRDLPKVILFCGVTRRRSARS